jgi:hypothetical protein
MLLHNDKLVKLPFIIKTVTFYSTYKRNYEMFQYFKNNEQIYLEININPWEL